MTISLCVILMETNQNVAFGLPLMVVLMIAKWVGDFFNQGIYDVQIQLAEVPVLAWDPPHLSAQISARYSFIIECVQKNQKETHFSSIFAIFPHFFC